MDAAIIIHRPAGEKREIWSQSKTRKLKLKWQTQYLDFSEIKHIRRTWTFRVLCMLRRSTINHQQEILRQTGVSLTYLSHLNKSQYNYQKFDRSGSIKGKWTENMLNGQYSYPGLTQYRNHCLLDCASCRVSTICPLLSVFIRRPILSHMNEDSLVYDRIKTCNLVTWHEQKKQH